MSVPVVPDYLESGDAAEHEKDPTQNKVIQNPGDACTEQRQGGEQSKVARLGVTGRRAAIERRKTKGAGARLTSAVQPWQPPAQVNGVSQYVPRLVPGRDSCRAGRVRQLRIRDAGEVQG